MNKIDSVFYQQLPLAPDFEFNIRVVRTQQDALDQGYGQYDLHYHSFWEIDLVVQGDGVNIFEDAVYSFEPGDIYIIHPYEMHNAFTNSEMEVFCIQFSEDTVVRSVFSDAEYSGEIARQGNRFVNLVRAGHPHYEELYTILQRTLDEWRGKRMGWRPATRLCLAQLFIELMRDFSTTDDREDLPLTEVSRQNRGIRQALNFINQNFTRKITLEQTARQAIMHKNYFCTVFRQQMGCTFYSYLNNLRLRHACSLLKSTEQPIKEVAISCGFTDISTFNKAFRKAMGMTPSVYREGLGHVGRSAMEHENADPDDESAFEVLDDEIADVLLKQERLLSSETYLSDTE